MSLYAVTYTLHSQQPPIVWVTFFSFPLLPGLVLNTSIIIPMFGPIYAPSYPPSPPFFLYRRRMITITMPCWACTYLTLLTTYHDGGTHNRNPCPFFHAHLTPFLGGGLINMYEYIGSFYTVLKITLNYSTLSFAVVTVKFFNPSIILD